MDLTLVPFGYSVLQKRLVDVHQVDSGKRCGCECPSCHTPLIARKGSKNIWHFAHDSSACTENEIDKCQYSFYVSVRMMARQLLGDSLSIHLPGYEVGVSQQVPLSADYVQASEWVTKSCDVVLTDVSTDSRLGPHKVDLSGYIEGYCLAIVFTHPGRESLVQWSDIDERKSGVIAISLADLRSRFAEVATTRRTYKEVLEDYISHDTASKRWLYHPRLRAAESTAKEKLARKLLAATSRHARKTTETRRRSTFDSALLAELEATKQSVDHGRGYTFTCRLCHSSWFGMNTTQSNCRKCGTALLVSREKIPDEDT